MKTLLLILTIVLPAVLNLWVWLFPRTFLNYLRLAKNPRYMGMPFQKGLWEFIESPHYIWLPRVIFGLALVIAIIMVYRVYFA